MGKKKNGNDTKRKKKGGAGSEGSPRKNGLQEETLRAIGAISFFVLTLFFLLASFELGGVVGDFVHTHLTRLFGVGYFLLPLLCGLVGVALLRSLEHRFSWIHASGGVMFFVSGLGIISLVLDNGNGGVLGGLIASPLLYLFEFYASFIILTALLVISLLVLFNTSIRGEHFVAMFSLFRKKEEAYEPSSESLSDDPKPEPSNENAEERPAEAEAPAPEPKEQSSSWFSGKKKKKDADEELVMDFKGGFLHEYNPPPLSLLKHDTGKPSVGDVKASANIIKRTLFNFGISVEMDEVSVGPSVTRYALKPAEGVKLSRIVGLQNDLALALAAHPLRIEAPIPGKSLVGIEIPNKSKATVGLGTLLSSEEFQNSPKPLLVSLGKSVSGVAHYSNLAKMPHLLIAGATGSGKSVTIHAIITSLLYRNSPENLKFIMVDPKRVELTLYNKIPHLLTPVITQPKDAIKALRWAAKEMDRRYDILESETVRDIDSYHKRVVHPAQEKLKKKMESDPSAAEEEAHLPESMPYIVIVIDELADIMATYPRELEASIVRLAQMSRAVGIHLILSTQRPSVNVITGLIKANIPARIALQVASQIDSRTILDASGAERLIGAGDMLYLSGEMAKPNRIQSAFITEDEAKKVVDHLSSSWQGGLTDEIDLDESISNSIFESALTDDDDDEDDLYEDARQVVMEAGKASTSFLQRKLKVGYNRGARLMDMLENRGVIGPADGAKPRQVLENAEGADQEDEYHGESANYQDDDEH